MLTKLKGFFALITLILIFTGGCSQETGPAVSIRFGELWDSEFNVSERINSLDGERVSMTGFMAMQSPLDGSFIYLTNAPMVTCPYCIPGTNTPVFAVPAIAPSQHPIKFTEQPVTISGKLEIVEKTDEFGYTTPFRINVDSLSIADIGEMPQSLKDYNMLATEGVTGEITALIDQAYKITDGQADQPVDIERINSLTNKIKRYEINSFDPLTVILDDLKELSLVLNEHIENDENEKLTNYNEDAFRLWENYFDWANNMAAIE